MRTKVHKIFEKNEKNKKNEKFWKFIFRQNFQEKYIQIAKKIDNTK